MERKIHIPNSIHSGGAVMYGTMYLFLFDAIETLDRWLMDKMPSVENPDDIDERTWGKMMRILYWKNILDKISWRLI